MGSSKTAGSNSAQSQTSTSEPWKPLQPYLKSLYEEAFKLYRGSPVSGGGTVPTNNPSAPKGDAGSGKGSGKGSGSNKPSPYAMR